MTLRTNFSFILSWRELTTISFVSFHSLESNAPGPDQLTLSFQSLGRIMAGRLVTFLSAVFKNSFLYDKNLFYQNRIQIQIPEYIEISFMFLYFNLNHKLKKLLMILSD